MCTITITNADVGAAYTHHREAKGIQVHDGDDGQPTRFTSPNTTTERYPESSAGPITATM